MVAMQSPTSEIVTVIVPRYDIKIRINAVVIIDNK